MTATLRSARTIRQGIGGFRWEHGTERFGNRSGRGHGAEQNLDTALATTLVRPKNTIRRTRVRQKGLDGHRHIGKHREDPDEKKDDRKNGNDTKYDGGEGQSTSGRCGAREHGHITWKSSRAARLLAR